MQIAAAEGFATLCGISYTADARAWAGNLGSLQRWPRKGDPRPRDPPQSP